MSDLVVKMDLEVQEDDELNIDVSEDDELSLKIEEGGGSGVSDYNELINKPTLNGEVMQGDMKEIDPTVPNWAKTPTKPDYTPEEVNAVNVDSVISLQDIDEMFKQVFS